jgi:hypothetical protein
MVKRATPEVRRYRRRGRIWLALAALLLIILLGVLLTRSQSGQSGEPGRPGASAPSAPTEWILAVAAAAGIVSTTTLGFLNLRQAKNKDRQLAPTIVVNIVGGPGVPEVTLTQLPSDGESPDPTQT